MKYFSLNCVNKAYALVSKETKDKFWGILAILYSIDNIVKPNISYNIDAVKLSSFLENIFRLKDKKIYENSNSEYSVVFSSVWVEKTIQNFLIGSPDIAPIIVWAYRRHSFSQTLSISELIAKFVSDFHLSKEVADDLFSLEHTSLELEYVDSLYEDIQLLKLIKGETYDVNKTTLKMGTDVAVANAGDLSRGPFFQPLYASLNTLECLTIYPFNVSEYYSLTKSKTLTKDLEEFLIKKTHQQIYFGAPGTGKSHKINKTEGMTEKNSIRTTFHPDSDYSTFVGCYKPTKKSQKILSIDDLIDKLKKAKNDTYPCQKIAAKYWRSFQRLTTEQIKSIISECEFTEAYYQEINKGIAIGEEMSKSDSINEITYEFIPQAFTSAYVNAWKNLEEPYYLVIEEINRGNCAQIFGDIFQLLDRDSKTGYSSYKITPDKDLQEYLCKAFADANIDDVEIKQGEKMQLPRNLNILATMNTSDQSLFPIDSAFKRRWDWKYIPINPTENKAFIVEEKYSWNSFLKIVNDHIESVTLSEDKKMGAWFVKADDKGCISAEKFVSKVVFYLWNDIFKDFSHDGNTIFKDEYKSFYKFFDYDGNVNIEVLKKFLQSLDVESDQSSTEFISAE